MIDDPSSPAPGPALPADRPLTFDMVVAADEGDGIGFEGKLPWELPGDLAFFKRVTRDTQAPAKRNAVVMGRKTWETIPARFRPLRRRLNAVITRQRAYQVPDGVLCEHSLEAALARIAAKGEAIERVFLVGGGEIYRLGIALPQCQRILLTRVLARFPCDAHFPKIGDDFALTHTSERHEENGVGYVFQTYQRRHPSRNP